MTLLTAAKLSDMRMTIHRILQPISSPPESNEALFLTFKEACLASRKLESFTAHVDSNEVQAILQYGKDSLRANPDLNATKSVPRYGWKSAAKQRAAVKHKKEPEVVKVEDTSVGLGEEDATRIVGDFKNNHPQIKVETEDEGRAITASDSPHTHRIILLTDKSSTSSTARARSSSGLRSMRRTPRTKFTSAALEIYHSSQPSTDV